MSRFLKREFDRTDDAYPQVGFFLRRRMSPGEGAERLIRARAALRAGMAVYLSGDVPWPSCHARIGRFLGLSRFFQAAWVDLAEASGTAVIPMFCLHRPEGRYELTFDAPFWPEPASALDRFLERLESEIARNPSEALAHLTWPCYTQLQEEQPVTKRRLPVATSS